MSADKQAGYWSAASSIDKRVRLIYEWLELSFFAGKDADKHPK
jgi:hypothetical protein